MKNNTAQQNIPNGWTSLSLGKIIVENSKSVLKVGDADNSGPYPFFTSGEKILAHSKSLISGQNIFMATGGVANIKYFDGDASYSTDTYSFKSNNNTKFIYYVLLANLGKINTQYFSGSGLKHLQKNDFKECLVILPENPEQQKIAEILGVMDEDIAKTQGVIEATEKLKRGLMQQLFTRGIGHTKFKETKNGEIPDGWRILPLSKLSDVIDSLHRTPVFSDSGFAMVRVTDIKNGYLNLDKTSKVNEEIYNEFTSNYVPKKNDIVMSRVGSYGISSYVNTNEKFCMGQNTVVINCHIEPRYIYYALNSSLIKDEIENEVAGSGYKALSLKSIRDLHIPVPDNNEQQKIAEILSSVDEKISVNKKLKEKLTLLKKGLMQDLLSGRVRVSI